MHDIPQINPMDLTKSFDEALQAYRKMTENGMLMELRKLRLTMALQDLDPDFRMVMFKELIEMCKVFERDINGNK